MKTLQPLPVFKRVGAILVLVGGASALATAYLHSIASPLLSMLMTLGFIILNIGAWHKYDAHFVILGFTRIPLDQASITISNSGDAVSISKGRRVYHLHSTIFVPDSWAEFLRDLKSKTEQDAAANP